MLFTTATLARTLGQDALAADRFRAIVVDYARQARAPGALDALSEMGHGDSVSPLQAGIVRQNGLDHAAAVDQFDQVDAQSPDWGPAQLDRVEALLKLGDENDACRRSKPSRRADRLRRERLATPRPASGKGWR